MRVPLPVYFAALVILGVAGCVTAPPGASTTITQPAEQTCRQISAPGSKEGRVYCGTSVQWAEVDRRTALINAGVTCRSMPMEREVCMNAEQWKIYDRRTRDHYQLTTMGDAVRVAPVADNASYGLTTAMPAGAMPIPTPPTTP